jgi:hypothetical protein
MKLQTNIGKVDAVIRYIIGIVLLLMVVLTEGPWRWLGLIGIIPIVTAAVSFCPLWRLFGINTKETGGHDTHTQVH